jgi:hypothetical protein
LKLKAVILERALKFGGGEWDAVPTAVYTADKFDLSFDPFTQLVRISNKAGAKHFHITKTVNIEVDEEAERAKDEEAVSGITLASLQLQAQAAQQQQAAAMQDDAWTNMQMPEFKPKKKPQ